MTLERVSRERTTSRCTPRVVKHVNKTPHRFSLDRRTVVSDFDQTFDTTGGSHCLSVNAKIFGCFLINLFNEKGSFCGLWSIRAVSSLFQTLFRNSSLFQNVVCERRETRCSLSTWILSALKYSSNSNNCILESTQCKISSNSCEDLEYSYILAFTPKSLDKILYLLALWKLLEIFDRNPDKRFIKSVKILNGMMFLV